MKHLVLLLCLGLLGGVALGQGQGQDDPVQPGKAVFEDSCAQCHRANGEGLPATFPAMVAATRTK
jgi:mono/diheme cytochrome c family protein